MLGFEEKLAHYEALLRSTEDHTRNWLKLAESYLNSGSRVTAAEYIERARRSANDVKGIAKNLRKIELKLEALGLLSGRG
ncbi:MAG: hypothetical protein Q8Q01_05505 [archaeon]|nr:hypothetical protein [archaeon]